MTTQEIQEKTILLKEQLLYALSTMDKKDDVKNIRNEIKQLQQICPHCDKYALINNYCPYCGKKVG